MKIKQLPLPLRILCFPVLIAGLAFALMLITLANMRDAKRGENKK